METNDLDFPIDFSSKGQSGQVLTMEDLLDTPEKQEELVIPSSNEETEELSKPDNKQAAPIDTKNEAKAENVELPSSDGLDYKSIVSTLVSKKIIEPIGSIELEDGTEVPFSDMDIDEETFAGILSQVLVSEREKANANKISVDGVSEFTKQLIEIEKSGGNVEQALDSYQRYIAPLDSLDMFKPDDQKAILYMRYRGQGLNDSEINRIIGGYETDGVLEEKALESKEMIQSAFDKQLEEIQRQADERNAQMEEALKAYKTNLGNSIAKLEVNDVMKRKLIDSATKKTDDGFLLDRAYFELRNNPEKAAELAMFILYKDEYVKRVTETTKRESAIDIMKKIKLVKQSPNTMVIDEEVPTKYSRKKEVSLDEFIFK